MFQKWPRRLVELLLPLCLLLGQNTGDGTGNEPQTSPERAASAANGANEERTRRRPPTQLSPGNIWFFPFNLFLLPSCRLREKPYCRRSVTNEKYSVLQRAQCLLRRRFVIVVRLVLEHRAVDLSAILPLRDWHLLFWPFTVYSVAVEWLYLHRQRYTQMRK